MRKDIQALRALAVLSVIAFHAQLGFASQGFLGVDVFFVISGYLIIGLLMKELETTGKINIARFVARRARRLIPAASVVLIAIVIATVIFIPGLTGRRIYSDVVAAALYVANLHFGATATDYWATHVLSPVLHFWSLGVEEQFYLMFPLLLLGVSFFGFSGRIRNRVVFGLLSFIGVSSCMFMLELGRSGSSWAFYSPFTRVWEFAVGGVAVLLSAKFTNHSLATPWIRVLSAATIFIAAGLVLSMTSVRMPWRGTTYELIVIVSITGFILFAGALLKSEKFSLEQVVSFQPIQWLGNISYSTYLWHWPVLFFGTALLNADAQHVGDVSKPQLICLVLLTLLSAHFTYVAVENPIRHLSILVASNRRSLLFGLILSLVVVTVSTASARLAPVRLSSNPIVNTENPRVVADENSAKVVRAIEEFAPQFSSTDRHPIGAEALEIALNDFPRSNRDGCFVTGQTDAKIRGCLYGDGKRLLALVGSSKANQFLTPLQNAATAVDARVLLHTRSGCTLADVTYVQNGRVWQACNRWKQSVMGDLLTRKPQLVVMVTRTQAVLDPETGIQASPRRAKQLFLEGLYETVQRLSSRGIKVLVIRDTPELSKNPLDCLSSHTVVACDQLLGTSLGKSFTEVMQLRQMPNVTTVDLAQAICEGALCPPVKSETVVWRDESHVTDSYAAKMTPLFKYLVRMALSKT